MSFCTNITRHIYGAFGGIFGGKSRMHANVTNVCVTVLKNVLLPCLCSLLMVWDTIHFSLSAERLCIACVSYLSTDVYQRWHKKKRFGYARMSAAYTSKPFSLGFFAFWFVFLLIFTLQTVSVNFFYASSPATGVARGIMFLGCPTVHPILRNTWRVFHLSQTSTWTEWLDFVGQRSRLLWLHKSQEFIR